MKRFFVFTVLLLGSFSNAAFSHPTSYKGALGVMTWNQPWLSDYWVTYSFRSDMALAARYMCMEMPEGRLEVYMPQFDILAKRWNEKDYQGNIYGYAGIGGAKMNAEKGTSVLGGIEADVESRSLFALGKIELMRPSMGEIFRHYEIKLGVAPYEAEFSEIASWFMIQYQYHPTLLKKQAITPLVRFFYRNVLWETGVSLDGDYQLNLMFHF
jgi:hypothetical protein